MQCERDQFTCNSGTCIDIDQRCNQVVDCEDFSDEGNCEPLGYFVKHYRKNVPAKLSIESKTPVEIRIDIESMRGVNELDMLFTARLRLEIRWRDERLFYRNLIDGYNTLSGEGINDIWKPALYLSNSAQLLNVLKEDGLLVQVAKQSNGNLMDEKELEEGKVYDGDKNDLVMSVEFDTQFFCVYQLHHYPFDTQRCNIELKAIPKTDVALTVGDFTLSPESTSPQFDQTLIGMYVGQNGSSIRGEFQLKRLPFYHILCTYLPTLCILAMALLTLFIDESHFEATIMVALTAMLVLYTLFQSISTDMPTTAYLKLLDIWLIFFLVMPFVIFCIEVIWELRNSSNINEVTPIDTTLMYPYNSKCKCKTIVQIMIPMICLTFITIYIVIVYIKYNQHE